MRELCPCRRERTPRQFKNGGLVEKGFAIGKGLELYVSISHTLEELQGEKKLARPAEVEAREPVRVNLEDERKKRVGEGKEGSWLHDVLAETGSR